MSKIAKRSIKSAKQARPDARGEVSRDEVSEEGGCLCGAIRYRVSGEPIVSGICHCRSCRRTAGAPMLPYVTFALDRFEVVAGAPADFQSSPPVTRSFCARCGTPLTYRHRDYPDRIDVMTCSLDDPEAFPPSEHLWVSHKPAWVKLADGLPAHDTTRDR
jgi:hypothetical protein